MILFFFAPVKTAVKSPSNPYWALDFSIVIFFGEGEAQDFDL